MAGTDQDLAGLPGPLADALRRTDVTVEMFDTLVTVNRDDYDIIRAELLRLVSDCIAQRLQADTYVAKYGEMRARMARAEAELAALKHAAGEYMAAVVAYNSNQWDRVNIRKYDAAKSKLGALVVLGCEA